MRRQKLKNYNELKKNIKRCRDNKYPVHINIGLLGDTATQFLAAAIEGMGYEYNMKADVFDAEYDSIETNVLDQTSELYECRRDFIILAMSTEKACEAFMKTPYPERRDFADRYMAKINSYWSSIGKRSDARIIQLNFNRINDGVFGNYGMKEPSAFDYQLQKLNMLLSEAASENKSVFLIDADRIQYELGRTVYTETKFYFQARMSMSFEALAAIAAEIFDVISAIRGKFRKCLVLDLDNTLWGGVIGDDGLNGIEIGELGTGRSYTDLQYWCRELEMRGIILAVCSKNDEDTAKEPFISHPDMVLHLDDFAVFTANWDDKATNIRKIQQTLNIGMDSMVFVDDNPFERNMVRELIPEITVPELPEDPSEYLTFLQSQNLFETASFSEEDMKRTKQYQEEAGRRSLEESFASIDDYLKSLDMTAEAKPFDEFHYPRIAQLSQRSNQFNLRTVRYTEEDIKRMASSDKYITLYFTLKDKFGDYGLISAVIIEKKDAVTGFIDTWFMSCRVLKRGMEEFIINTMVEAAEKAGIEKLVGEYIRTPKNNMVSGIYPRLGFKAVNDSVSEVSVKEFVKNKTYVISSRHQELLSAR